MDLLDLNSVKKKKFKNKVSHYKKKGTTAVICSVNGPVEVQMRDEKLDEATVEVVFKPAKGLSTTKERVIEHTLRTTFEPIILGGMMPRTLVQITIQILKDDGSALAASVNAISLALLDSGVPLKHLAAAATCMVDSKTNQVILDPTAVELQVKARHKVRSINFFILEC